MSKLFWNYIVPLIFVALSFGFCYDYVVKMYNLKNQQISTDQQVEREELEDLSGGYYSIKYNLDGGVADNPDKYNLFTATFTLNNPTKVDGYKFVGWTSETLTEPTIEVTIYQGSAGNLEFTANYDLVLKAPEISLSETTISRNVVENADYYQLCINNKKNDLHKIEKTQLSLEILDYLYYFSAGSNEFKLRSCMVDNGEVIYSAWSNSVFYEYTKQHEAPTLLSVNNNILSWSHNLEVAATTYIISVDGTECFYAGSTSAFNGEVYTFDLTKYKRDLYFTEGTHLITICADASYKHTRSESSNAYEFTCVYFDDIELTNPGIYPTCDDCETMLGNSTPICPECGYELTYVWGAVAYADKYLIKVVDFDNQNIVVTEYYTDDNNRSFKYSDYDSLYTAGHKYLLKIIPISNSMNYVYYSQGIANLATYPFNG